MEDGAKPELRAEGGTLGKKQWAREAPSHPSRWWGLVGLLCLLVEIKSVGCPGGSAVKTLPVNAVDAGSLSGQEDPLEEEMATHPSFLAWEIPWTEEPGGLCTIHRVSKS